MLARQSKACFVLFSNMMIAVCLTVPFWKTEIVLWSISYPLMCLLDWHPGMLAPSIHSWSRYSTNIDSASTCLKLCWEIQLMKMKRGLQFEQSFLMLICCEEQGLCASEENTALLKTSCPLFWCCCVNRWDPLPGSSQRSESLYQIVTTTSDTTVDHWSLWGQCYHMEGLQADNFLNPCSVSGNPVC